MKIFFSICLIIIVGLNHANGQEEGKSKKALIKVTKADKLSNKRNIGNNVNRFIGNVVVKHENTILYCDSAYVNPYTNQMDAYGHVHINENDSLNIYGDSLKFNGNNKIVHINGNVRLVDPQITLMSNNLTYDLSSNTGFYHNGGTITGQNNVLISKHGYYYSESKLLFFKNDVQLTNPNYVMNSDTLKYHTLSEIAYFFGPTHIKSNENLIYCESGWYNTKTNISSFNKNAWLKNQDQVINADSFYYERNTGFGVAKSNVEIIDTINNILLLGQFCEYQQIKNYSLITDSAVAIIIDNTDSLYLHADTLFFEMDSAKEGKELKAYYHVKMYREDLQGKCDSLVYIASDSVMKVLGNPVLWNENNQIVADTIFIFLENNKPKRMALRSKCFITQENDSLKYNQIKGKRMKIFFENNSIKGFDAFQNAETIYYLYDEDSMLNGIGKSISTDVFIRFVDDEINEILFDKSPDYTIFPPSQLPHSERFLKDFIWHSDIRPLKKEDIFIWDKTTSTTTSSEKTDKK